MANEFFSREQEPGGLKGQDDVEFLRSMAQAYKRLSEGLSMRSPAIIGEAHNTLERLKSGGVGGLVEESEEKQELVWVKNELEKILKSVNEVLKG